MSEEAQQAGMWAAMATVFVVALSIFTYFAYQCLFATAVNAEKESRHENSVPQMRSSTISKSTPIHPTVWGEVSDVPRHRNLRLQGGKL